MPPKKKQRMLFHSSDVIRSGLQKSHGGKRILLKASLIYSKGNIPAGEKDYLFQYSIRTINSDCSTSIIDFDERYVVEGGHEFLNYPNIDPGDEEPSIPNYQLESIIVVSCTILILGGETRSRMTSWKHAVLRMKL